MLLEVFGPVLVLSEDPAELAEYPGVIEEVEHKVRFEFFKGVPISGVQVAAACTLELREGERNGVLVLGNTLQPLRLVFSELIHESDLRELRVREYLIDGQGFEGKRIQILVDIRELSQVVRVVFVC